jgi:hypothetical protein
MFGNGSYTMEDNQLGKAQSRAVSQQSSSPGVLSAVGFVRVHTQSQLTIESERPSTIETLSTLMHSAALPSITLQCEPWRHELG